MSLYNVFPVTHYNVYRLKPRLHQRNMLCGNMLRATSNLLLATSNLLCATCCRAKCCYYGIFTFISHGGKSWFGLV